MAKARAMRQPKMTTRRWMIAVAVIVLLVTAVSRLVEVEYARRHPEDALASYFLRHGIELKPDGQLSHWWIVTRPAAGDFRVAVALRSFPLSATEQQMEDELMGISLAFILNAPAHIAMSYPGLRGTRPDSVQRSPADEVTSKKMIDLFERYRPPSLFQQ
jgi:hypothetical protein